MSKDERDEVEVKLARAERALISAGWTYVEGAAEWKPPIGPSASPLLDRIAELERQQGLLVARLRESNGILQAFKTQSQTAALQLIDNELTLEHIWLARDSVKPAGQKGGDRG
jgi:hypothetical protein